MGSGASNQANKVKNISSSNETTSSTSIDVTNKISESSNTTKSTINKLNEETPVKNVSDQTTPCSVLKDNNTTKRETPQPKIYSNVKPTTVAKSQLSNFTEPKQDEVSMSLNQLKDKLKQVENELAESESQRLDGIDQLQILQEQLHAASSQSKSTVPLTSSASQGGKLPPVAELSSTVHAKDQLILRLERQLKAQEADAKAQRLKLKRRVKNLTSQLAEAKHEASVAGLESQGLRGELKDAKVAQNTGSAKTATIGSAAPLDAPLDAGHSKIIVALSNQLSEQSERISSLESELEAKDSLIQELKSASKNSTPIPNSASPSSPPAPMGDRLQSGRGSRYSKTTNKSQYSRNNDLEPSSSHRQELQSRMSTALSDSDSDWEMQETPRPQTRSAPARARIKSAVSVKSVAKDPSIKEDDNSILQYIEPKTSGSLPLRDASTSQAASRPGKKSARQARLEKQKQDQENGGLMGPSLAFAQPGLAPPHECNSLEPTPRTWDNPSRLPGFSKLQVIHAGEI